MYFSDFVASIRLLDEFSDTFDRFDRRSEQAERRVENMGDALKQIGMKWDASAQRWRNAQGQLVSAVAELANQNMAAGLGETAAAMEQLAPGMGRLVQRFTALATSTESLGAGLLYAGATAYGFLREQEKIGRALLENEAILVRVGRRYGLSADEIVAEWERVGRGAINQAEATRRATQMLLADQGRLARVVRGSADAFGQVAEMARLVAVLEEKAGRSADAGAVGAGIIQALGEGDLAALERATRGYLDLSAAVQRWEADQGTALTSLSQQQRMIQLLALAAEQATAAARDLGLEQATVAEETATVNTEMQNLKDAFAVFVAESNVPAVGGDFLGGLTANIERQIDVRRNVRQIESLLNVLEESSPEAAGKFQDAMNEIYADIARTGSASEGTANKIEDLLHAILIFKDAVSGGGGGDGGDGDRLMIAPTDLMAATEALTRFKARIVELTSLNFDDTVEGLAQLAAEAQRLMGGGAPEAPTLGATALSTDVGALEQYLDALERANPELQTYTQEVRGTLEALREQQERLLQSALYIRDNEMALEMLAEAYFGAGAGVQDLVANFEQLPPELQSVVQQFDSVQAALEDFRASASVPINIQVAMDVAGVGGRLQNVYSRLLGLLPAEEVKQLYDKALDDFETFAQNYIDAGGDAGVAWEFAMQEWLKSQSDWVTAILNENRRLEQGQQEHLARMREMQGIVTQVVMEGLQPSQLDFLETDLGQYQDKPLEAARRLQDIINRGMESPWVSFFDIPEDVLARGEAAVKAWAIRLREDVINLERPDLIDLDAFDRQLREYMEGQAARKSTIEMLVQRAIAQGYSPEKAREAVEKMAGIAKPELELETKLMLPKGGVESLMEKIENGMMTAGQGIGAALASVWGASVDEHEDEYRNIGEKLGTWAGDEFVDAVKGAVGNVRVELAKLLAPEVARQLRNAQGGALP